MSVVSDIQIISMDQCDDKSVEVVVGAPENVAHKVHVQSDLEWNGEDPFNLFQLSDKLGEGSFGSVWKVVTKDQGHKETALAIKQIKVSEETYIEDIEKEIKILKQCKSQNIVSYYGVFRLGSILWILMDYCGLGSVADIIDVNGKPFDEKPAAWIILNALHGLAYLHKLGIVHRDVKGGNILVTEQGDIKLADFGVSEKLEKIVGEVAGTPLWMAPEVAKRGEVYNHKADIWSLGITLIEIVDGEPPLSELNAYRVMLAIQRNDPPTVHNPKNMSHNFIDFLNHCLVKDYNNRWDTTGALEHIYVSNAKQEHIKDIVEKTAKNRKKQKFRKAAKIDNSPRHMEPRIIKKDIEEKGAHYIPLAGDDIIGTSCVALDTDTATTSIVRHGSPPKLVRPIASPAPPPSSNSPLWAQPGYIPSTEESFSKIVQVIDRPLNAASGVLSSLPVLAKEPNLNGNKTNGQGKKDIVGDLDYTTPRVSVTENSPLVQREDDDQKLCPCCSCTIL